ncbi:MAG: MBL fold metallo-hydrolase, partial [Bacteroidales bacterium]|nr:MBL fold metallo-hydrolase [Bacteroidales bacterium]
MWVGEDGAVHSNNCADIYLVVGKKQALLIDLSNAIKWADNAAESLQKIVADRIGNKELHITFTHNHPDHIGMIPAFYDNPAVKWDLPRIDFTSVADKFPAENSSFYDENGHVFDLGGVQVETLLAPGHTDGSVLFLVKSLNLLFTGDALGSGQGVWIFNASSLEKFMNSVPVVVDYLQNPANGVNCNLLKIYGGHYWQRVGQTDMQEGEELGMQFLLDMKTLTEKVKQGNATVEPYNNGFMGLDTKFCHDKAAIVCNGAAAAALVGEAE